ncbi:amidohydrolase [Sansalvadorimonas sp. 2012CJ34-2]|uniref:Amidohydrolase n=1 Tax=Parendozoicomonas callyspongiae TaxID=2942213 RepID=A0ABT0PEF0_9GAMM|nr:amidohydrolase [Sansalvadorimonas sp. 2012CJ34-2]MCL6269745.1 amidohydrolase [Sansalvadorimonas sp. 2012CJ34-2]
MNTIEYVEQWHQEITSWRQDLHSFPEVGFDLHQTAQFVEDKLISWGIEVDRSFGKTGVVGILDGNLGPGRTIAYRADMDALPMQDNTGKPYASKFDGAAHACGHDGHTAMLLATARYLSEHRDFKGRVVFLFQPAEEIGAGARAMMEDGLFETYPFDEVYGFHNMPRLKENTVSLRYGPITGAGEKFSLKVSGSSGHSSVPHKCVNPITISAKIITAWQSIVTECIPSSEMCVLAVTKIQGGEVFNSIPESAEAGGTIRFYEKEVGNCLKRRMKQVAQSIADAYDAEAEVEFEVLCPATVNTTEHVDCVVDIAKQTVGANNVDTNVEPSPGGEDMAFFKKDDNVGACYFMIGSKGTNLHTCDFDFDDSIIPMGVTILCRIAQQRLN